ncbi:MAG: invasion associated locus B family protein [Alphaproteobacteria bacterium]|nr:invasion associated locus B family protein [Alphaproteobacteria bacterium]MDP6516591.1 invasion associated locus B family protein [Alphaproteobacteria bacterium]
MLGTMIAALGVGWAGVVAAADGDQVLGRFKDWTTVTFVEDGIEVCYIVSQPKKSEGDYTKRGAAYVQVTRRGPSASDVVSFEAGYPFRAEVEVVVEIDNKTFKLFGHGETAWAYGEDGDREMVSAMRSGKRMTVRGVSQRGTKTTDRYSLFGFTKAHKTMVEECG